MITSIETEKVCLLNKMEIEGIALDGKLLANRLEITSCSFATILHTLYYIVLE
jgi:DNA polymerase I-like protein with 3'-5' exonuclease and polymerase domains